MVRVGIDAGFLDDERLDLFIAQDGADAAASGLLEPDAPATRVVPAKVEAAEQRVIRAVPALTLEMARFSASLSANMATTSSPTG